jgi:hypothetical protein
MKHLFVLFTALFTLSAQAAIGDAYVFMPDKKQDFAQCDAAQKAKMTFVQEAIPGTKEMIRYYYQGIPQAKAVVISFHGNAGSACNMVGLAPYIEKHQVSYVYAEYPGFSPKGAANNAKPTEVRTLANALALFEHVRAQQAQGLPIYLHGMSLGTGVATYVAMKMQNTAGIILDGAYTSMREVGKHLGGGMDVVKIFTFMAKDWAPSVTAPVFMIHAKDDQTIPYEMGEEESKNFTHAKNLLFHTDEDGGHLGKVDTAPYWQMIQEWIDSRN